jgi:hypothetical protein
LFCHHKEALTVTEQTEASPIQSPWLTPAQAGAYLNISVSTLAVWRCRKDHPLKFSLCGTRIRYRAEDLDAFVAGCRVRRRASPNVGRPPGKTGSRRNFRRTR